MTRRFGGSLWSAGVAVAAVIAVVAGVGVAQQTEAAWSDPSTFAVKASAGSWAVTQPDPKAPADVVISPGNETTAVDGVVWNVASTPGNGDFCVTMRVTGRSATPTAWEVRADMSLPPFNGHVGTESIYYTGSTQVALSTLPSNNGVLVVKGIGAGDPPSSPNWNAGYNNRLITNQQQLEVKLCVSQSPPPLLGDPTWYTVTQAQGSTWTSTQACVVLTATGKVTDTAANPFWFGWKGTIDLTAAKQRITGAGKTVSYMGWSPDPGSGYAFTTTPGVNLPPQNSYEITSGRVTPLRGTSSTTITACVYGY
jgi:hypothetical protein